MKIKLSDTARLEIKNNAARVNDGVWHEFEPGEKPVELTSIMRLSSTTVAMVYDGRTIIVYVQGDLLSFREP